MLTRCGEGKLIELVCYPLFRFSSRSQTDAHITSRFTMKADENPPYMWETQLMACAQEMWNVVGHFIHLTYSSQALMSQPIQKH
jgi:hypothetical protein